MYGRQADDGMDAMLGGELGHLIDYADRGFFATIAEARRIRKRYDRIGPKAVVPRVCARYAKGRDCPWDAECTHLHLERDGRKTDIFQSYAQHAYD